MRRVGVQLIARVRYGALEDDEQHDEHAGVDKVAHALHAEGQHHLQALSTCRRKPHHVLKVSSCEDITLKVSIMGTAICLALSVPHCHHSISRALAPAAELAPLNA